MNSIKYVKKTLYTIVFSIIVTTMLSFGADAEAYSGVCGAEGDNLLWSFDSENGTLTISGDGDMEVWQTSLSAPWNEHCDSIKNIEFEGNIRSIDDYAFDGCCNLTSVVIPNSVTRIGRGAFRNCLNLNKITLPFIGEGIGETDSEKDVFGFIFGYTTTETDGTVWQYESKNNYYYFIPNSINSVTITNESTISGNAFYGCDFLTNIELNTGVLSIGYNAFYRCSNLCNIIIPEGVTAIGYKAFFGCNKLKSIIVPKSVQTLGRAAFKACSNLETLSLPFIGEWEGPSTLGFVFDYSKRDGEYDYECSYYDDDYYHKSYYIRQNYGIWDSIYTVIPKSLKKIYITNDSSIPYGAFYNCTSLTEIVICDGVKTIDECAFYNCTSLEKITFPSSLTYINPLAFEKCSNDWTVYGYEGSYANSFAIDNNIDFISLGLARFDIKYDANGGENIPDVQNKTAFLSIELSTQKPYRKGFTFKGYGLENDGAVIYLPGDIYTENADLYLYAIWEANSYNISFNTVGGDTQHEVKTLVYQQKYNTLPKPTKTGYTFDGWYLENEYINPIDKNSILNIAKDHTLYAKWNVIHINSVSLNYSSISAKIGETTSFLTATVSPSTALDKSVKWSSSDESIATVDQSGNITGISSGSAVITVTANDGNYTDTCTVNVTMVVDPVFSDHASGFVEKGTVIKLFTPTEGTTIYYTKDGSIPDKSDYLYNGAITINSDSTIKAIAIAPDGGKSTSSTYEYETVSTSAYSIEVDTIGACAGNTVELDVLFNNNPGVHGLVATITFDESVLTLEKIKNGVLFADDEMYDSERTSSSCVLYYEKSNGDTTKDGVLTTLVFKVSDNAGFGNYPVTISYLSGDIVDSDEDMVITETIQGAVNIYPLVFGDVNYDGIVNMQDIVRFKSHLAGIDVVINEEGSDVNHDGDINLLDLYAIRRFLACLGEIEAPASVMAEDNSSIALPTVSAKKGQTIRFDIQLKDSAGLWGLNPLISYDKDYLKLIGIENGAVFADGDLTEGDISSDEYALLFTNESSLTENNTSSGKLITLIFKVIKESPDGITPITLSFDNEHIAMNVSGEKVDISTSMGIIAFDDNFVLPDVNNDGVLNGSDLTTFVSYMSGAESKFENESAIDFDGNKVINLYDLNRFIDFLRKCDLKNK